ncbi:hypothetical protein LIER_21972 [Lithospermum erythrorhizon]|uniref:Uncharacterized protein n=1 Tax=Lithospermum erythrorhizon TaxID=34254 RepID=A0AAV3QVB1_LITER
MNANGIDNRPPGDDALNLNNLVAGRNDDALLNPQEPIHIGSRKMSLEVGSSHPQEMAGLITGLTRQIVHSIKEELRERLPQLRGDTPTISSSIREETYTHTPPVRMNDYT